MASPVAIENAGFEDPVLELNTFTNSDVPGWTIEGGGFFDAGVYHILSPRAPEGNNTAYIEVVPASISQQLDISLSAGMRYILNVAIARRPDRPNISGYRIELMAGTAVLGSVDATVVEPPPGEWADTRIAYLAADEDANLGQPISVRLSSTTNQPNFDNVRLDAEACLGLEDCDGDGLDDGADNCQLSVNPNQRDSDGDGYGYGNICDADLNNDCVVNALDLGLFRTVFFSDDADADLNGDGSVNVIDLGLMRSLFFSRPGPSGLEDACQTG
ncbi:MAG: hypothetical protein AB8G17_05115 [Gammaproteobacteria bacterium]